MSVVVWYKGGEVTWRLTSLSAKRIIQAWALDGPFVSKRWIFPYFSSDLSNQTSTAVWFIKCCVYVIMHVKYPQLFAERGGHRVLIEGFCLSLYSLHSAEKGHWYIQSIVQPPSSIQIHTIMFTERLFITQLHNCVYGGNIQVSRNIGTLQTMRVTAVDHMFILVFRGRTCIISAGCGNAAVVLEAKTTTHPHLWSSLFHLLGKGPTRVCRFHHTQFFMAYHKRRSKRQTGKRDIDWSPISDPTCLVQVVSSNFFFLSGKVFLLC